ncbi:hypothetical protein F5Y19DRAFT_485020 [Xylariaceae sp. FL1651]|nr:hypothetical protein F5Y19DRAFT_485020 [Xylariaceae sp. FL1651]
MHSFKLVLMISGFSAFALANTIHIQDIDLEQPRYKIGENVWSTVPPANDATDQSVALSVKRDLPPNIDELRDDFEKTLEWLQTHPDTQAHDLSETDVVPRAAWPDTLARCVVAMGACYATCRDNPGTIADKLTQ